MAYSSLVNIKVPAAASNYSNSSYRKKITNVCLHHMAGVLTAKQCGDIFARNGKKVSAHYGIGSDGKIGGYVDETCVAWHAGNWPENQCSVGIEISNSSLGGNWPVSNQSIQLAIKLVADIMKRNGIKRAVKGKTLTWHSMYVATTCPGDCLRSKIDYICAEVNKILGGSTPTPTPTPTPKPKDPFLPAKGYWGPGDNDKRVSQIATFMRRNFPSYTPRAALGPQYGPNLTKSIKEFQRRTKMAKVDQDGCVGPKTLAKLRSFGFPY
jgi:hypothetical protein